MGEFKVTYNYVCNRNIQYMYAGNKAVLKRGYDYPNFDMLRLQKENSTLKRNILKSNETNKEKKFFLPKAPAFRNYSRFAMEEVVGRLQSPTLAKSLKSSQESISSSVTCPKTSSSDFDFSLHAKEQYGHRKLPKEQVDLIVDRLLRQHTVMSEMKVKDKFEGHTTPFIEVVA